MDFNLAKLKQLDDFLEGEVEASRLPGAAYAVGIGAEVVHENVVGYAENRKGQCRPMRRDTIFDLASLTKVTATLPSILQLIDSGLIRLNDPIGLFLPQFGQGEKAEITVRHLLTHTSGLVSGRKYYESASSRAEVLALILAESPQVPPETRVVYSDIGFILLAQVVEAVTGQRIDRYAQDRIFRPLGMAQTTYCPPPERYGQIAATEEFPDIGVKVGIVHDENAYTMGGVSGHAGLFAPLSDMVAYLQMWLSKENPVLSEAVRKAALKCYTSHLDGRRALGWVCRGDAHDHTGDLWPDTTVGHTGFTGTSLAFDPVSKLWSVLLTNDVHYGRENKTIVRLRGRVHNLVAAALINLQP
ncbi:Beta-lactamase [Acididesulfobacillus acetoxydans]|uniref:Beta-lactamase n=1 Tax=Acididesulfobacillus acetoxydans TaxID=1561005 RepID=A0A8S0VXT0_9FIRM|nr:serine hydrolase domain-containing protein [Acididesulfobacillus acetoxydans]CAA7602263.1 Beta-lactamase [Acididesulfobacillus acetoxydans]CEJ07519.1 UPF0214 protein YfeW [Acididesulfobacillus acetoxydans]